MYYKLYFRYKCIKYFYKYISFINVYFYMYLFYYFLLLIYLPPREGNANPLQYSCLGNPQAGYSPWSHKELDMTEQLNNSIFIIISYYILMKADNAFF